jgi:hypothetical protein
MARFGKPLNNGLKVEVAMATKSRAQRKVDLQRLIKTEFGRLQVREKLKVKLGLQPWQSLPAGTLLVTATLDYEFGPA